MCAMTEKEEAEAVVVGLADPPWRLLVGVDQLEDQPLTYLLSCGHRMEEKEKPASTWRWYQCWECLRT